MLDVGAYQRNLPVSSRFWNDDCTRRLCVVSAKAMGEALSAALAGIASQELGGPPHRASDLFFSFLLAWGEKDHQTTRLQLRYEAAFEAVRFGEELSGTFRR